VPLAIESGDEESHCRVFEVVASSLEAGVSVDHVIDELRQA